MPRHKASGAPMRSMQLLVLALLAAAAMVAEGRAAAGHELERRALGSNVRNQQESSQNVSARASAGAFDCKHIKARNFVFDLSPISFPVTLESSEPTPPTTTKRIITINLCEPLADDGSPADQQCPPGTQVCMKIVNEKQGEGARVTQVVATAGGDEEASRGMADLGEHLAGAERVLQLELIGSLYAERRQRTKFDMRCSPNAPADSKPRVESYIHIDGELKMVWDTKYACAKTMGRPGDGEDGGDKDADRRPGSGTSPADGSWGFFSWFFFLIFFGGIVYIAAGLWRNYNEYGVIELPNRDFWREAPYIAKDVGKHVYHTVSGQGSSRGGYEPV